MRNCYPDQCPTSQHTQDSIEQTVTGNLQLRDAPCPTFDCLPHPGFLFKQGLAEQSTCSMFGFVEALPAQDECVRLAIHDIMAQGFHRIVLPEQVRVGAGSGLTESLPSLIDVDEDLPG